MLKTRALPKLGAACRRLLPLLISLLSAFLIAGLIMWVAGFDPLEAYAAMLRGSLGELAECRSVSDLLNCRHIGDLLEYAMILCLCGLACVLAARVGIFNVGGEGQLLLGAIFACQIGVWMDGTTAWLVLPCAALTAMCVGAFYALIPGLLKVKVKVNEVITTIMLNTIAAYLCAYLSKGPWKDANPNRVAATESLDPRYWFGGLIPRSNLTTAIFAAAVIAFLVWYIMQKTAKGFEMKLTGQNPRFARFAGIRTDRLMIGCMAISGAMCGLAGMFRVYGAEHVYSGSVSSDYYFEGLMVAMIARYQPLPVIGLSLLFAILKIGAEEMHLIGVPTQIYQIIQTVVIFCIAAEGGITAAIRAGRQKRKAKRAAQRMGGGADE